MARKLKPQTVLNRLNERWTQKEIREATGISERQQRRIKSGETSGKQSERVLREFYDSKVKDQKKAVAREVQLENKRQPKQPKEAPPVEPKEEQPPAAPPDQVDVSVFGNIGPDSNDEYIRPRRISVELKGDYARNFTEIYTADKMEGLRYAVSYYFDDLHGIGPGYLESVIGKPSINYH